MKFNLKISNRPNFVKKINKIGSDKKWFCFVYHSVDLFYYDLNYITNKVKLEIGQCVLKKNKSSIDCSFLIYPEYRNNSFARMFLEQIVENEKNIQFTVSNYNINSMKLFESISELKKSEINIKTKTYRFYKNDNLTII